MNGTRIKPVCERLSGCIGTAWCDYCGDPIPTAERVWRDRLAAFIAHLSGARRREDVAA